MTKIKVDPETREIVEMTTQQQREFQSKNKIVSESVDKTPPIQKQHRVDDATLIGIPKISLFLARAILCAAIGFNGFIIWHHVILTMHQFLIGNDAAFPPGWERYDLIQLGFWSIFLLFFSAIGIWLEWNIRNERRHQYGV